MDKKPGRTMSQNVIGPVQQLAAQRLGLSWHCHTTSVRSARPARMWRYAVRLAWFVNHRERWHRSPGETLTSN